MQDSVFSAVAKQDGGRKGQKVSFRSSSLFTRFDNRLSASICHYIQLDISNTATASYDSPSKSHCHHVVPRTRPQGHVRFQDGGQTGPPDAVYMEPGSS